MTEIETVSERLRIAHDRCAALDGINNDDLIAMLDAADALSRRSLDTADGVERFEPFADQDDGEFKGMGAVPDGDWVRYSDWALERGAYTAAHAEVVRLSDASRTPNTETVVKDESVAALKLVRATITLMLESGSWDAETMQRVDDNIGGLIDQYLASPPSPAEVRQIAASAMRLCAKAEAAYGFMDMSSNEAKENWASFCEAKGELLKLSTAALDQLGKEG